MWRHDPGAVPEAKIEGRRCDAALSFPFGIGTKAADRRHPINRADHGVSQLRFLHFAPMHCRSDRWRSASRLESVVPNTLDVA